MNHTTLDRVLEVNKQLAALAKVGVPLDLGCRQPGQSVDASLEHINAELALRVSRGQSVEKALAEGRKIPQRYRAVMQTGLHGDSIASILEGVSRRAIAVDGLRSTVGYSLVQPLVLFTLFYFAFVFLCVSVSPTFEGIYRQLYRQPSTSVALLATARQWLPYWAPVPPLLVILGVLVWRRGSRQRFVTIQGRKRWRWIPGATDYLSATTRANFADQLAMLLENNVPLAEGLPLAAAATGDSSLVAAAETITEAGKKGAGTFCRNGPKGTLSKRFLTPFCPSPNQREVRALPPLLRWALTSDLGEEPLAPILRFASATYRQAAEHREAVWNVAIPALAGAVLGGVFVFTYGLCVFLPVIQLLQDLSAPIF